MAKSHTAQAAQAWTLRAQNLNEDTARSQTPCSYEVQLLDVNWGTLMAESHIQRARLETARCTPMAENHIPRARLKAAKKSLHRFFDDRGSDGVASTASSAQGSVLTVVPTAGSAFAEAHIWETVMVFLCCFEHCAWDVVFSHGSAPCGFEPCAWDVASSHECAPVDIEELHFI